MRDKPVGVRFNDGDAASEIRNSRTVILTRGGVLRMRWMSPREYARLQGADDFPLVGTTNQQLFGFGDAVCVPVIKWIDDRVLTPIAASLEPVRR
jgi:DNA (cytosine-5)-methyltransferase 1